MFFLFIGLSAGLFYLIVLFNFFQVKNIQVQESDLKLQSAIQELIGRSIEKNVAVFRTRSIFLVDSEKIETAALNQFLEIDSMQIKRNFPNTILAIIKNREEIALWCQTQDICFSLDKKGIIFQEKKPQGEFIIENSGKAGTPKLGNAVFQENSVSLLLDFKARVEKLNEFSNNHTAFASVLLVSDTQFNYKTSEGWNAYMNPQEDVDWQITKLQTVLAQKIPSDQRKKLDYIDLRFGDQAYIKYR